MIRIMISGVSSCCGKTTVTCAVLQALVNRGLDVSSFKCGSDYIDPMFHSRIIGAKSRNLDSWFCNRDTLNYLLHKNSLDVSVIEGVMGYYDGVGNVSSSFQTAEDTGTPAVIVIDCKGMSMSIGAVMQGFLDFNEHSQIIGFIFNRLPESLDGMARELCKRLNTEYLGRLPYDRECAIESRHLGLITADEIDGLKEKMQRLAELAEKHLLIDKLLDLSETAVDIAYKKPYIGMANIKKPIRIAVAYDSAFCFYYEDNLDLLRELGCEIVSFSPLFDKALPVDISGLIIGGGYPELYAETLSENKQMLNDIYDKIGRGLPTIAECGGFMYLHKRLACNKDMSYNMVGIIDGETYKTDKLQRFGYVTLTAKTNNLLCRVGEKIAAHEFHYFDSTACGNGFIAEKASNGTKYECAFSDENIYAGFPHLYYYANPGIAASFVKKCEGYRSRNEQT